MPSDPLGLGHNILNAGGPSGLQELAVTVQGEHYHCGFRSDGSDRSRRRKSIHLGHLQVQDH
jgi:hypothetical protein